MLKKYELSITLYRTELLKWSIFSGGLVVAGDDDIMEQSNAALTLLGGNACA